MAWRQPSIITLWVLGVKKALIQTWMGPDIPQNSSLLMCLRWGTVLKALLKSSTLVSICSLWSRRGYMSWEVMSSCDSQECLLWRPWFTGGRIPRASRCARKCEHKMCSNNLQATRTGQWNWSVVGCVRSCPFLEDWWNPSCSPGWGQLSTGVCLLEQTCKDRSKFIWELTKEAQWDFIWSWGLRWVYTS